jgi:hypothetical protein
LNNKKFNKKMYQAWLKYCGLPLSHKYIFTPMKRTNIPRAIKKIEKVEYSKEGKTVWSVINEVESSDEKIKKPKLVNIKKIKNILLDWELPETPVSAIRIGRIFRKKIIQKGLAPETLPLEISGAGCHIIINTPEITITNAKEAKAYNEAIKHVIRTHFQPLMDEACEEYNETTGYDIRFSLECPSIEHLTSPMGTWRESRKEKDCHQLKQGFLRRWDKPHKDSYPTRCEWEPLRDIIVLAKEMIEKDAQDSKYEVAINLAHEVDSTLFEIEYGMTSDEVIKWIDNKIEAYKKAGTYTSDCSAAFMKILFAFAHKTSVAIAIEFSEIISLRTCPRYAKQKRHREEAIRCFKKFKPVKKKSTVDRKLARSVKVSVNKKTRKNGVRKTEEQTREIQQFISSFCVLGDSQDNVERETLYKAYVQQSSAPITINQFTRVLGIDYDISVRRIQRQCTSRRFYTGIRLT